MFQGFTEEAIEFLFSIRLNNSQAFFEENRAVYERSIKQPLRELAMDLAPTMLGIDPLLDTRPGRVCSRIRRDTRFSKDKSPYRDHMWVSWRYAQQRQGESFSMYWSVAPEGMEWGCGLYDASKPLMDALRARMRTRPSELMDILEKPYIKKNFMLYGPEYKRLEVPADLPEALRALYIKKGFYLVRKDTGEFADLLYSEKLVKQLEKEFTALAPLYNYVQQTRAEIRMD